MPFRVFEFSRKFFKSRFFRIFLHENPRFEEQNSGCENFGFSGTEPRVFVLIISGVFGLSCNKITRKPEIIVLRILGFRLNIYAKTGKPAEMAQLNHHRE